MTRVAQPDRRAAAARARQPGRRRRHRDQRHHAPGAQPDAARPRSSHELEAAGVAERDITIVNGTGLHREQHATTSSREMLGAEICPADCRIVQHVARDRSTLVEVGRSNGRAGRALPRLRRGRRAHRHRLRRAAPLRRLLGRRQGRHARRRRRRHRHEQPRRRQPRPPEGQLVRHARQPGLGRDSARSVALCPPHFLLNVTLDSERRVTGVFAGDLAPAHEAAIEQAASQYQVPITHPYDVVVVTEHGLPGRHHVLPVREGHVGGGGGRARRRRHRPGRRLRRGHRQRRLRRRPARRRIARRSCST